MDFVQVIGRGGFGTVWKGRCKASGHLFAVKEFNDKINDKQNIDRELQRLMTLRHDNIVKVFGWFFEGERLHGVFELLHHSVREEMQKYSCRGLNRAVLKRYTYQILRAVDFLHSVNIVHRDIKPHNILVSEAGVIKLADLGLSEKADLEVNPLVKSGTKAFMAPELHLALCTNYKRSDVWAVGCTILAMARGLILFNKRTREQVLLDIINTVGPLTERQQRRFDHIYNYQPVLEKPLDFSEKYMVTDKRLVNIIEGCLQMDPRRRATCNQLLHYEYFTDSKFNKRFLIELDTMVRKDKVERGQPWEPLSLPLEFSSPECMANGIVMAEPAVEIDLAPIDEMVNLGGNKDEEKESPECMANRIEMAEPAVEIDLAPIDEMVNVGGNKDEEKESPECMANGIEMAEPAVEIDPAPIDEMENLGGNKDEEKEFPEVTASRVVAENPAVLNDPEATDKIEILEEERDGEREERAVNEERPAEEKVKTKRGFRAAIRRTLSTIRRRFTFCCLGVSRGSSVQGHQE